MTGRLPFESDEDYFNRMVRLHKPVSDHAPAPAPEPLSGTPEWMENFWANLAQKKSEPSCSTTSTTSSTPRETGTRPKTSRRSSTRVTPPSDPEEELWIKALYEEPYETPKWFKNRMKWDDKYKYVPEALAISYYDKGGYTFVLTQKGRQNMFLDMELRVDSSGKPYFWWGPKEELWRQLKKLDLKDPVIIEKIRIACSNNPEGTNESSEKSNTK